MLSKNTLVLLAAVSLVSGTVSVSQKLLPQYTLADGSTVERLEPGQAYVSKKNGYAWYKLPLMLISSGSSLAGLFLLPSVRRRYSAILQDEAIHTNARLKAVAEVAEEEARADAIYAAEQRAIAQQGYVLMPATESQVTESSPQQPISQSALPTSQQSQAHQPSSVDSRQLTIDDAQNILFERIFASKRKHMLIPAETGAGKTTLLLGAVDYGLKRNPVTDFYFSTAKPGPFLGYEDKIAPDGKKHVVLLNMSKSYTVEPLVARLEWVTAQMVKRQNQRMQAEKNGQPYDPSPMIVVLDEWLATLELADFHTKEMIREWQSVPANERGDKPINYQDTLVSMVNNIAIMGREDNVAVWIFGQDHQVQNAGINTGLQKNFGVVVPFAVGAEQAIEHALVGRSPIPTHAQGKEIYASAIARLKESPNAFLAYSNISGHEILNMPYLPDIKRKQLFNEAHEPSSTHISAAPETQQAQAVTKDVMDVIKLKRQGTEIVDAICQVYGCQKNTHEFNQAKLTLLHFIS
ncbi:MAG: hypothetical protein AAGA46_03420 [Cyanobacteria bacterium P01_F01_bin.13]